jgi:hypothetical protein
VAQTEFVLLNVLKICVETTSGLVIVGHCVGGLYVLAMTRSIRQAQLIVANGALLGFSIKLIATFLALIELQTWDRIAMFVCVFALRTVLKRVLQWEKRHLEGSESGGSEARV